MTDDIQTSTDQFFTLTPHRVLDAVEKMGVRCTGRCTPLNSMENRVYEVEIEVDESKVESPSDRFRVVKFYRPGRWSRAQIQEEHDFLLSLEQQELPVIAPVVSEKGESVLEVEELGVYGALFLKRGGRTEPELGDNKLERLGRLLARVHAVGATRNALVRPHFTPQTYGRNNLQFLLERGFVPLEVRQNYEQLVEMVVTFLEAQWPKESMQRIHGDCHIGNILWQEDAPLLLDFDDMVIGPPVQDLWLILPGRDEEAQRQRDVLLYAYEQMRSFDRSSWRLVEGLRALRFIHFSAWIGKRWEDPSFQKIFPQYGTPQYWREQIANLQEQVEILHSGGSQQFY
jgi:Ser/Thr protein kinase RdoA (MazF antagonist)